MKLVRRSFQKDGAGFITLVPDDAEDIWHLYNLVRPGDKLKAVTFRKVQVRPDSCCPPIVYTCSNGSRVTTSYNDIAFDACLTSCISHHALRRWLHSRAMFSRCD